MELKSLICSLLAALSFAACDNGPQHSNVNPTMGSLGITGTVGGGGGKGVVCRDADKNVLSVELLDLWEAKNVFGYTLDASMANLPVETIVENMIPVLNDSIYSSTAFYNPFDQAHEFGNRLRFEVKDFLPNSNGVAHWLRGTTLTPTPDSFEISKPSNCNVEQLVTYVDSLPDANRGGAFINQDLVDKMDNMNKAALFLHESYYKNLRLYFKETDSRRTRRAIGYAMSGQKFIPITNFISDAYVKCDVNAEIFFSRVDDQLFIDVASVGANPVIGRKWSTATFAKGAKAPLIDTMLGGSSDCSSNKNSIHTGVISGSGPVDYDQTYGSYGVVCNNGKIKVYVSKDSKINYQDSSELKKLSPLHCDQIQGEYYSYL